MESQLKAAAVTAASCWPQGVKRLLVVEGWTAVYCGVAAGWEKTQRSCCGEGRDPRPGLGNLAGGAVQLAGSNRKLTQQPIKSM